MAAAETVQQIADAVADKIGDAVPAVVGVTDFIASLAFVAAISNFVSPHLYLLRLATK